MEKGERVLASADALSAGAYWERSRASELMEALPGSREGRARTGGASGTGAAAGASIAAIAGRERGRGPSRAGSRPS